VRRSFPRYRVPLVLPLLALFGICALLNTVPSLVATTAVVTLFAFRDDVGAVEAVVVGVAGAVLGRVLFALAVRHGAERFLRGRLRRNIDFLRDYVGRKRHATRFLALLAMMPVNPALAIFATAGALRLRLTPIVAGYALGRALVYGWAVWSAGIAIDSLERVLRENASPWTFAGGIALALVPLIIAAQVDWQTLIEQRRVRLLPRHQA
jgi:uncharacterized membrane protein YdjX (TVP38/TMEM64 family)